MGITVQARSGLSRHVDFHPCDWINEREHPQAAMRAFIAKYAIHAYAPAWPFYSQRFFFCLSDSRASIEFWSLEEKSRNETNCGREMIASLAQRAFRQISAIVVASQLCKLANLGRAALVGLCRLMPGIGRKFLDCCECNDCGHISYT